MAKNEWENDVHKKIIFPYLLINLFKQKDASVLLKVISIWTS